MTTFLLLWVVLCALLLLLVWGMGKAGSRADEEAQSAFRSLSLRQLARRRGERRRGERRGRSAPIAAERRTGERRQMFRRRDPTLADPRQTLRRRRLVLVLGQRAQDQDDGRSSG
jgi:hypothetical protein